MLRILSSTGLLVQDWDHIISKSANVELFKNVQLKTNSKTPSTFISDSQKQMPLFEKEQKNHPSFLPKPGLMCHFELGLINGLV